MKKGLTLVPVESENSQLFVLEGVLKINDEMKAGDVNIIEGEGKGIVPKLNKEHLKSSVVSELLTKGKGPLTEQWFVNKVPVNQLQFVWKFKDKRLADVIQVRDLERQNLKCCFDQEGSSAAVKLKTNRMKDPEDKVNDLLKINELCGSSANGLSLENIGDKIAPVKGVCDGLFHTGEQANHVRVKWKRGQRLTKCHFEQQDLVLSSRNST
ncbi:uncharacterized protein LOC132382033 [Hypanus sabinus]|uniref:uncharacterized protein LOC132382033 n=1 Tax=Hypanus sabinus TaxID=79690 RepID=UPI0028C4E7FB|nr:uncharacterized protein LOC132382033 [Hypanus sabinus]